MVSRWEQDIPSLIEKAEKGLINKQALRSNIIKPQYVCCYISSIIWINFDNALEKPRSGDTQTIPANLDILQADGGK